MDNSSPLIARNENDLIEELSTPMARERSRLSSPTPSRKRLRTITELALAHHHTLPEGNSTHLQDYLLNLDLSGQVVRLKEGFYSDRHGGFGDVWEGEMMNQKVAIKILRRAGEEKVKKRAVKELYNWSLLKHKNIQQFLGYCWDFGNFISMISPWQANGSAKTFLIGKCRSDSFRIMTGATQGLAYLHSRGLIHGDFKGDNILVSMAGQALVTDFGLSRMLDDQYVSSSGPGGNYAWMSPELFDPGSEAIHTKESDVWACGMTILELFSGQKPFHHCHNDAQIITQLARGVLPIRSPNIDDTVWELCTRCWNKKPSLRPEADSVARELRASGPKTRALIISILYDGQTLDGRSLQIDNDHSAALELRDLLVGNYGYDERDIKMLLEGEEQPTRNNMIRAMRDLVYNPQDGDRFFVFYSGLGSTSSQLERSEVESLVETLWPMDHLYEPNISGDELYDILIRPVKDRNCRLTYIFYCSSSPYGGDVGEHSTFGSSSMSPIDVLHSSMAGISMDLNPPKEDIATKPPEDEYTLEPASRKLQRHQDQLLIKYLVTNPSTSVLRTMKKSSPKPSVDLSTDGSMDTGEEFQEYDEDVPPSPNRFHMQVDTAVKVHDKDSVENTPVDLDVNLEDFNPGSEIRSRPPPASEYYDHPQPRLGSSPPLLTTPENIYDATSPVHSFNADLTPSRPHESLRTASTTSFSTSPNARHLADLSGPSGMDALSRSQMDRKSPTGRDLNAPHRRLESTRSKYGAGGEFQADWTYWKPTTKPLVPQPPSEEPPPPAPVPSTARPAWRIVHPKPTRDRINKAKVAAVIQAEAEAREPVRSWVCCM